MDLNNLLTYLRLSFKSKICLQHKNPVLLVCFAKNCHQNIHICQQCFQNHQDHLDRCISLSNIDFFIDSIQNPQFQKLFESKLGSLKKFCADQKLMFMGLVKRIRDDLQEMEALFEARMSEIEQSCEQLTKASLSHQIERFLNNSEQFESQQEFKQYLLKEVRVERGGVEKRSQNLFNERQLQTLDTYRDFVDKNIKFRTQINQKIDQIQSFSKQTLSELLPPDYKLLLIRLRGLEYLKSDKVEKIFKSIDRKDFTTTDPYEDNAQRIGFNTTISAPHMHATTLEHLVQSASKAKKVLDIGIGSGFMTLALAKLVNSETSLVVGIDHIKGILNLARRNINKNHSEYLEKNRIILCLGDGKNGFPEYAPYDLIHLGAAAQMNVVEKILEQLAEGGVLIGPIAEEDGSQSFSMIQKDANGLIQKNDLFDVLYGALCEKQKQWDREDEELEQI